jgi:hypothetical protein
MMEGIDINDLCPNMFKDVTRCGGTLKCRTIKEMAHIAANPGQVDEKHQSNGFRRPLVKESDLAIPDTRDLLKSVAGIRHQRCPKNPYSLLV